MRSRQGILVEIRPVSVRAAVAEEMRGFELRQKARAERRRAKREGWQAKTPAPLQLSIDELLVGEGERVERLAAEMGRLGVTEAAAELREIAAELRGMVN